MNILIICLCISLIFAANAAAKPTDTNDYPDENYSENVTLSDSDPESEAESTEYTEENKKPMDANCTP